MEFYCKRQQLMLTFHSSEHNIQIVDRIIDRITYEALNYIYKTEALN